MPQAFIMALEHNPSTAWMVVLGRIITAIMGAFFQFIDNERGVLHGLISAGLLMIAYHLLSHPVLASASGYIYFRTHWPFSNSGWACVFLFASLLGFSVMLMGRKVVLYNADEDERRIHNLVVMVQFIVQMLLSGTFATIGYGFHMGNKNGMAYYGFMLIAIISVWVAIRTYRKDGIWTA